MSWQHVATPHLLPWMQNTMGLEVDPVGLVEQQVGVEKDPVGLEELELESEASLSCSNLYGGLLGIPSELVS